MYIPDTPQDHDNRIYQVGVADGREIGIQAVADALAHAAANAVGRGDEATAKKYADARACVREIFPNVE